MITRLFVPLVGLTAAAVLASVVAARTWTRRWQADIEESERAFPGDDLIAEPSVVRTWGITIEATPAKIWPWLVQMGHGRAGWYSYDRLAGGATPSSDEILPEFQSLKPGDILPTYPGGGFKVEIVEPSKALVLSLSDELVREQAREAGVAKEEALPSAGSTGQARPEIRIPKFAGTWAFSLRSIEGGRTRLLERIRIELPDPRTRSMVGPLSEFGIFVMARQQMLGIRYRVEHPGAEDIAASEAEKVPAQGVAAEAGPAEAELASV